MEQHETVRQLIDCVRARWRRLQACRAIVRAALAAVVVLAAALTAIVWAGGAPALLTGIVLVALGLTIGVVAWGLLPMRVRPTDRQVARFIEERAPALEDRLVTAVDVAAGDRPVPPALAPPMLADAARRAADVEPGGIIDAETLRRAGFQAAAAALVLLAVMVGGRKPAREALDATALTLFPGRVALEVTPGNARVKAGNTLAIQARLVGNRAPVVAQLQVADGDQWRSAVMSSDTPGSFSFTSEPLASSFKYRVVAGALTSPT